MDRYLSMHIHLSRFNPDVYSPGVVHPDLAGEAYKKQCQLVKVAIYFSFNLSLCSIFSFYGNLFSIFPLRRSGR